ncbi:MAG: aminopeptidase P family protein [Candidatus Marsarchaeota archaeon]|nr:aminopeptidase P family protein [Candidatus Marsarchaeota archaeon]MCL5413082.1 aminopeptidase P family protein [Candidatus Marsarchaeota archaeon]
MDRKTLDRRVGRVLGAAKGAESILLANTGSEDPNFIYMTDLLGGLFEGSYLLITKSRVTLFTSPLEYEMAVGQLNGMIGVVNLDSKEKVGLLKKELRGKDIGFNGSFVPYNMYMRLRKGLGIHGLVDTSAAFEAARRVKDSLEISRIREANRITKRAIAEVQKGLKLGVTEREVAAEFDSLILKMGADGTSFSSIVSFGKNAALPHHAPDDTRLKYGDFVLMDVGVKCSNYCSDVTRTMIFGSDTGRIKDLEKKERIISIVKEAQRMAIASIKEGIRGDKPHLIAENHINTSDGGAYKGTFIHSLGHSIGIEVHDGSGRFLAPGSKLILKPGMVTSVEPGIYIPGFGGARFEDDIVVTKDGAEIL